MEYTKLVVGIGLIMVFAWILFENRKRSGFVYALGRIDTIIGMIAGLYLVITSFHSLIF